MGFRKATNDWLSIVLKFIGIIALIFGVAFLGISIYGNIKSNSSDIPDPPGIEKADYKITLKATGQELYTDEVIILGNGKYEVDGYYELIDDKWKKLDNTLVLDEYYFGGIVVVRR